MPGKDELPSTIARSSAKAQRTWIKAHDAAAKEYGEGEHSHRVAFGALKHSFEKVGDHWEAKGHRGPSDPQDARSGAAARRGGRTGEGVDENATRSHLAEVARRLKIPGRSGMRKDQLIEAIRHANRTATRKAREG